MGIKLYSIQKVYLIFHTVDVLGVFEVGVQLFNIVCGKFKTLSGRRRQDLNIVVLVFNIKTVYLVGLLAQLFKVVVENVGESFDGAH